MWFMLPFGKQNSKEQFIKNASEIYGFCLMGKFKETVDRDCRLLTNTYNV